jgi:hypothetical protein
MVGATIGIIAFFWAVPAFPYEDEIGAEYLDRTYQSEAEQAFGSYLPMIVTHEIDFNHMVAFIELDGSLLTGTDSACQLFAYMMKYITSNGLLVYITNDGYIPTRHNPIDYDWAKKLVEK